MLSPCSFSPQAEMKHYLDYNLFRLRRNYSSPVKFLNIIDTIIQWVAWAIMAQVTFLHIHRHQHAALFWGSSIQNCQFLSSIDPMDFSEQTMECINEGIMLSSPREVSAGNVHPFSLSPANKNQWSQKVQLRWHWIKKKTIITVVRKLLIWKKQ